MTNDQMTQIVHSIGADGRVSLTYLDAEGKEQPTFIMKALVDAIRLAEQPKQRERHCLSVDVTDEFGCIYRAGTPLPNGVYKPK